MKLRLACLAIVLVVGAGVSLGQSTRKAPTALPRPPAVVGKVTLTAQSNQIPQTTIFTPRTNGLFRLSYYGTSTVASSSYGCWEVWFYWTDEAGSHQNQFNNLLYPGSIQGCDAVGIEADYSAPTEDATIIRGIAGAPIQFAVVPLYNTEGSQYELFISVEQLQ